MNRKIASLASGLAMLLATALARAADIPRYDHVVIVMDENKDYSQIIDSPSAPYITALSRQGANLTRCFAEEHHSEGNYLWLFSGDRQSVDFTDGIPPQQFTTPNLAASLIARGLAFTGYAENLPATGSLVSKSKTYVRKHNPYVNWQTPKGAEPGPNQVPASTNQPFTSFPADFTKLPTVCWIVPNLISDMHDGSIQQGDAWLKRKLDAYVQWAPTHNSLLIFTFDENSQGKNGPTNPADPDNANHIVTIFIGANIRPGNYAEGAGVTHVNVLRTLEKMYGLPREGAQTPAATAAGISDEPITDVFTTPPSVAPAAGN